MKIQLGVCAAVLLGSLSTAALADDPTYGPYLSVGGGISFLDSISPSGTGNNTSIDFKDGYLVTGAAGWGFGNGLRTELEIGWHDNNAKQPFVQNSTPGTFIFGGNGRATQETLFGNALYDFDTGTPWTPHVGFGIGIDSARVDNVNLPAGSNPVNTHDTVFAYQGIVGVEYAVAPGFHLGVEYRYIGTSDLEILLPGRASNNGNVQSSYSLASNNILATLRYSFGEAPMASPPVVAPPPAPPQPAPPQAIEPSREFQVFFDFDKSDITAAAAKVIQAAADTVNAGHIAHLTVTGHTDTVGSAQYNQGLSERRAASVKKQLIADGVAGGEIATVGVGKTGLLVPTKDGVREAQNRRATIDLQ
jgi:OmpA-OmpF porin, OOP family